MRAGRFRAAVLALVLLHATLAHARSGGGTAFRSDAAHSYGSFSVLDLWPDDAEERCVEEGGEGGVEEMEGELAGGQVVVALAAAALGINTNPFDVTGVLRFD